MRDIGSSEVNAVAAIHTFAVKLLVENVDQADNDEIRETITEIQGRAKQAENIIELMKASNIKSADMLNAIQKVSQMVSESYQTINSLLIELTRRGVNIDA